MPHETKPIQLNVPCPDFSLPRIDDQVRSLKDYTGKVLVVAFTCNHCPYVQAYEQRLIKLVKAFQNQGVDFVCINSNDAQKYPEDSFAEMKSRAARLGFNFDYLRDETQSVARAFNAACTPEFYVYDEARRLKYHGRLDDNYQNEEAAKHFYLRDAIEDLRAGRDVQHPQTSAIGCSIKWR